MAARRFAAAGQARAYGGHDVARGVALQSAGPLRIIGRTVRKEFLNPARLPASTMVGVAALAKPELLLQVEAYAVVKRG